MTYDPPASNASTGLSPGGHPNSSTGGHPKFLHLIEHSGA